AGETWQQSVLHKGKINELGLTGNTLLAAGDSGMLMYKAAGKSWKGEKGTGFIVYFLNFFGPFVFIWLCFLMMYSLLPNTHVPFKPAAIGAALTGTIWVVFILSFIIYVKSFASGTFAIYGALAAFPIFLLLIYTSALIILYGAEVSYMIVYIEGYIKHKRIRQTENTLSVYSGLRILFYIYEKFETGKGSSSLTELQKLCEKSGEAEYYTGFFKARAIIMDAGQGAIAPSTSSGRLKISELIDLVHDASLAIPSTAPSDRLKKQVAKIFEEMTISRKNIIGDLTMEDIIRSKA
ncbi:MAG: YihY/virulence factor BrkB family protein, partial [Spirochaetota bacterium]